MTFYKLTKISKNPNDLRTKESTDLLGGLSLIPKLELKAIQEVCSNVLMSGLMLHQYRLKTSLHSP